MNLVSLPIYNQDGFNGGNTGNISLGVNEGTFEHTSTPLQPLAPQ